MIENEPSMEVVSEKLEMTGDYTGRFSALEMRELECLQRHRRYDRELPINRSTFRKKLYIHEINFRILQFIETIIENLQ